jgi:integrase
VTTERMRAASTPRDATLISVLAYAGLRPGEALALQWRDIREQTILVERGRVARRGERHEDRSASHRPAPAAARLRSP